MPVTVLLCEGPAQGTDGVLLGAIFSGALEVRPSGGKYGLPNLINSSNDMQGGGHYGFRDRDFDSFYGWYPAQQVPLRWHEQSQGENVTHFGWAWRRTELENYLLDPIAVSACFGEPAWIGQFEEAVSVACNNLVPYTAARYALGHSRSHLNRLSSGFGQPRPSFNGHPRPQSLIEPDIRAQMLGVVSAWNEGIVVNLESVEELYEEFLARLDGGDMHNDLPAFVSGKDLFIELEQFFITNGFASASVFQDELLSRLRNQIALGTDLLAWVSEWQQLREDVLSIS